MTTPEIVIGDDGIVRVDYGSTGVVTLDLVRAELEARRRLAPGMQILMVTLRGVWRVDVDAAAFMSSAEWCAATGASGMVVESSLGNMAMRVFELYHRPSYPFRICATEDDAVEWLAQYIPSRQVRRQR